MGGKTSTSTSQVSIPPEVLARYQSVNQQAQDVASTPFQQYSTDPNAFVAPLTPTQTAGINATNQYSQSAQPYYNAATGFALAGSQAVNPSALDTSAYMNPYLQTVLGNTAAQINQNNQQAMSGATGNAMSQGYFGGDRSGIASAVLQGQQNLAAGQVYSGIASDAYNQALAAAQQQQGVQLGAAQANRAATQQTGETLANLGAGAQSSALAGAQAQLGAGQVQQQTTQAGDTALYNQFLQQQSYPFQVAQFLANIAEGTGALSGNTTTTTQPGGLFSDERLKEDMRPIGKGFDGANIYRFRYRDDPHNLTRIGFSAQEMEHKHPEAVGQDPASGYKTVDYGAATDEAAHMGGFARAANDDEPRQARQAGGMAQWGSYPPGVNPMSIGELLQAQAQMYGPGFEGAGLYGGSSSGMPHGGSSYVPAPMGGSPMMLHGTPPPTRPQTTAADALHDAAGLSGDVKGLQDDAKDVQGFADWVKAPTQGQFIQSVIQNANTPDVPFAGGGFVRAHRQDGGGFDPSDPENDNPYGTKGPGLNIPTEQTQHQQLQPAQPPKQSGDSTMNDIMDIAKMAAMFASAAKRGGRVGRAAGGEADDAVVSDLAGDDPMLGDLLRSTLHRGPGFARAAAPAEPATAAPGEPAGGGPPLDAPSGGFAGAGPPGASAEAAAPTSASGLPAGFAGIFKAEGTGKNPSSSARGPGQFIDSTFKRMFRQLYPDRAAGMSDSDILALRSTPEGDKLSMAMIPALDAENTAALTKAGFEATPVNRHLAWVLGSGGAKKVLGADPSTPLSDIVSPQAIAANRRIMAGKTAGEFINWAAKGMNKGGRVGFQDGGDTGLVAGPDDTTVGGFDPAVVEQAQKNRQAAAAGLPSTPAAQAAVGAAPAGGGGFSNAQPPADWGLTHAELNNAQEQDRVRQLTEAQTGQGGQPSGGGFPARAGHWLTQPEHFIPLAEGVADMISAPTQHPLVALAQGLKGGMGAYQQQRAYDLAQAQKAAEIGAVNIGEEASAQTARASVLATQGDLLNRASAIFDQQYMKRTGPDGTPQWVSSNPNEPPLNYAQYMQKRNAFLLDAMGRMGGAGGSTGPLGALAGTTGINAGGAGPPGIGVAASEVPSGSGGLPTNGAGVVGGGGGAGSGAGVLLPHNAAGVLPSVPGGERAADAANGALAAAARPSNAVPGGHGVGNLPDGAAAGPGGGAGAGHVVGAGAVAAAQPGRTFAQRLTRGDYSQLPVERPTPNYDGLAPGSNPQALRIKATNEQGYGQLDQANADRKLADQIESGQTQAFDANNQPDMRFVQLQQARQRYDAANQSAMQQQAQNVEAARSWIAHAGQTEQALRQADDIYANLDSNVNSPEWAKLVGRIRSIPMMDGFTPDSWKAFQTNVERGEKVQALQQINQVMGGLGHAPASGLHVTGLATPSPGMSPGARYSLVHQQWEQYLRDQQYMNDVATHGGSVLNWTKFNNDWAHDHPPEAFQDEATRQIGPQYFAGMLGDEKKAHPYVPRTQAELNGLPAGVPVYWKGKLGWTQ